MRKHQVSHGSNLQNNAYFYVSVADRKCMYVMKLLLVPIIFYVRRTQGLRHRNLHELNTLFMSQWGILTAFPHMDFGVNNVINWKLHTKTCVDLSDELLLQSALLIFVASSAR